MTQSLVIYKNYFKTVLFLLILLHTGLSGFAQEQEIVYRLPFLDGDARYFFYDDNILYIGDYPARTIYRTTISNDCEKILDIAGWAANDAVMFQQRILFCSRDRILFKEQDKVRTQTIPGTSNLVSITAGGESLFLLNKKENGLTADILILDKVFSVIKIIPCPLRNPLDLYWHEDGLWMYDQADKCIYRMDIAARKLTARVLAPVGNSWSRGILFIKNQLYVHDRLSSSLVPVFWKQDGKAFYSCFEETSFTFSNFTKNNSTTETTKAEFRIPVPESLQGMNIISFKWSAQPDEIKTDCFGQKLAYFINISILPGKEHLLSFTATMRHSAVQYLLDEVSLDSLKTIPEDIKQLYLGADKYIPTNDPVLIGHAKQARLDAMGKEPAGVKALIENLAGYIVSHLSYIDDDKWESASTIITSSTGSCSEYSFLFSALARINNIPTRLAGGVQTDGAFHRWTEVYYPEAGWIPVDVTKIDSSSVESYDYEYLFGKSSREIVLSRIGAPDASPLGVNYYIYRYYTGGKRERSTEIRNITTHPVFLLQERILHLPKP